MVFPGKAKHQQILPIIVEGPPSRKLDFPNIYVIFSIDFPNTYNAYLLSNVTDSFLVILVNEGDFSNLVCSRFSPLLLMLP